jgi:predicted enzyme related to lactoylglutathione lyase
MERQLGLVIYPTSNLEASKKLFRTLLGVEPYAEAPYYAGFRPGDIEIGLDPNASARGIEGPVVYWSTPRLEASVEALVSAGATVHQPVTEVGGGMRIAILRDGDSNLIGLREAAR